MADDIRPCDALIRRADLDKTLVWTHAEFLDEYLPDGLILRALVCPFGDGEWQWTISSLEGLSRGELISAGFEKSVAAARLVATSEIAKCLDNVIPRRIDWGDLW